MMIGTKIYRTLQKIFQALLNDLCTLYYICPHDNHERGALTESFSK